MLTVSQNILCFKVFLSLNHNKNVNPGDGSNIKQEKLEVTTIEEQNNPSMYVGYNLKFKQKKIRIFSD
jgi:hypothetical protein